MLLFWYVDEGSAVVEEEDLAEIETAKAVVIVKAPASGVLRQVLVREGDAVDPGQTLAVIECPD
ncbi:MAG: biotin/lipoyl-binding protein [Armatimonadetes bacterium]|nr:biotin/lipoyl-binding protein [Armatimonadota bacterium]